MEHANRVDPARRHLVAGVGVVVDLHFLTVAGRVAQLVEVRGTADVDDETARCAERVGQLVEGARQRSVGVGSANREHALTGSQQSEAFRRREPQRTLEVLGEPDRDAIPTQVDVDEPIGGVRRQAAELQQRELPLQLATGHPEPRGEVVEMLARAGEDPRHQREHLAQAVGREGSRAHEPSRAGVSAARVCNHCTTSSRTEGGSSTVA